jgi:hypothetical protein
MNKKFIFVMRQPGTANAFIPLIRALKRHKHVEIEMLAFDLSSALLEQERLEFTKIENFADALNFLDSKANYLVTGTSEKVADDALFWAWANEHRIPSLAFVDQWSNLAERFACQNLPTDVGVLDEHAQHELTGILKDRSVVHIVGSPVFDALKKNIALSSGLKNTKTILFVLEPDISGMSDADIRNAHGFTEYECLCAGFKCARAYARKKNVSFRYVLKPHPRDHQDRIYELIRKLQFDVSDVPVEVWKGSREAALIASDLVIGMRSMLLLEAAFVQRPVISIQLNRKTSCVLTDDRSGIWLAVTENDIDMALDNFMTASVSRSIDTDIQKFSSIERFMEILGAP